MTEPRPLHLSFDVACSPAHAFTTWTSRLSAWWPRDHTVSGTAGTQVVLEGHVGGRIYERTADGAEHDWGRVTAWEPPGRLRYRWHLAQDPDRATDVEIRFAAVGDGTRVEIEHRGWERWGDLAATMRDRNRHGWETLLPHFVSAAGPVTTGRGEPEWQQGRRTTPGS